MAFPSAASNGQLYSTSDGRVYIYNILSDTWDFKSDSSVTQNNVSATVDPTSSDNASSGYSVGSYWINVSNGVIFTATSVSPGSATWIQTSNIPITKSTSDPLLTSDINSGFTVGSLWINSTTSNTFILIDSSAGAAVWVGTASTPTSIFVGSVPLLSPISTAYLKIPFTTVDSISINNVSGSLTVLTGGTYKLSLTSYISAVSPGVGYFVKLFVDGVPDPIFGKTIVDTNAGATTYTAICHLHKTRTLSANSVIEILQYSDSVSTTYGCDLTIQRIS